VRRDADRVHRQARGDECDQPRGDRVGGQAGDVDADEPDRGQRQHGRGRRRVDGGEDVAHRGQPVDRGDDVVVYGVDRLELHDHPVGSDGQQVHPQQQRRTDGQVSGVMRRDQVEIDVGERLEQRAGAEARRRRRGVGIACQHLVADDRAGGVADRLADPDDARLMLVFKGGEGLGAHPRKHRLQRPGVDRSAATLNIWAFSTVR
jgi:hypothetical protein